MSLNDQLDLLSGSGLQKNVMDSMARACRFHGHICPGLAIGVSASLSFLEGRTRSHDEEIVAIVENDACGVDGIQVLLGCTFGKGNLMFQDHGKSVYTFIDRQTGKGKRYSFRGLPAEDDPGTSDLNEKVRNGNATQEESVAYGKIRIDRAALVLKGGEELFDITDAKIPVPEKARIFESFICHGCGEKVSSHRAVEIDGKRFCISCKGKG